MRHTYHLKISLHEAVLTRSAVLHDVGIIELDLFSSNNSREISLVNLRTLVLGQHYPHRVLLPVSCHRPFAEAGKNFINIVSRSVDT